MGRNTAVQLPPLIEDLSLSYRLRLATEPATGLVVLLHGVGHNETGLAGFLNLLPSSLAVALVRSPIQAGPNAYRAFTVNFTPKGPMIDAAEAESSRRMLVCFIGELQARTGIPAARTLIAGFSQGGIMSAGLALTAPETVAGFGILSGRILPEISPLIAPREKLSHLSALILHGEQDDVLPAAWAERSAGLLHQLGVPFEQHRYAAGHEITPDMEAAFAAWVERRLSPA
jgi:phospholipase/carboxylesterase